MPAKAVHQYALSPMQQGMLFHSLFSPDSSGYCVNLELSLRGDIDLLAFRESWAEIVRRHDILRTHFTWEGLEQPLQVVYEDAPVAWQEYDWSMIPRDLAEQRYRQVQRQARHRRFDLSRMPLIHFLISRLTQRSYQFHLSFHHILLDGWSLSVIFQELELIYQARVTGASHHLPLPRPFYDYIRRLEEQVDSTASRYWEQLLRDANEAGQLRLGPEPPSRGSVPQFENQLICLPKDRTSKLMSTARAHHVTISNLILACWMVTLGLCTGRSDIMVGVTISGRPPNLKGVESMVGLFINTLPVRVRLRGETRVLELAAEIQMQQGMLQQYGHSRLVDVYRAGNTPLGEDLFDCIVVFGNVPGVRRDLAQSPLFDVIDGEFSDPPHYPLSLFVGTDDRIGIRATFRRDRFEPPVVQWLLEQLDHLLEHCGGASDVGLGRLAIKEVANHERIMPLPKRPPVERRTVCVHEQVQEMSHAHPDRTAVVHGPRSTTYRQLGELSRRVSSLLRQHDACPGDRIGICMRPSTELVAATLAILRIGAAYVPVAADWPKERQQEVIQDSGCKLVVTDSAASDLGPARALQISSNALQTGNDEPRWERQDLSLAHTAYVIYTSGSSGRPRGVVVSHRAVASFLDSMRKAVNWNTSDCFLSLTPLSFDISVLEIFLPLTTGSKVIIGESDLVRRGDEVANLMARHNVTYIQAPPAAWEMLLASGWQCRRSNTTILCGGDLMTDHLACRLLETGASVWNLYGPTECTVWCTAHRVSPDDMRVLIGTPLENTIVHIMGHDLRPLPIRAKGEICVAGAALADGYLGLPRQTAERFVPDPLPGANGRRLYRTGDIARIHSDQQIEFLGRNDRQFKLNGVRIEPNEIEARLNLVDDVKRSVVVVRRDGAGHRRLIAYVAMEQGCPFQESACREALAQRLPKAMVPARIVCLPSLPLTSNGKVNFAELPPPPPNPPSEDNDRSKPVGTRERLIASIWKSVLGHEQIGCRQNFFDLGGDSLTLLQLFGRLKCHFSSRFSIVDLFENPTIEKQSVLLTNEKSEDCFRNRVNERVKRRLRTSTRTSRKR